MDVLNPLYKNQGIHTVIALFTIIQGELKVLLVKRKNEPFKDSWILVGGAVYNNENLEAATERELFEKTGLMHVHYEMFDVFSDPNRSPLMRMLAIGYIGVVSAEKSKFLTETLKTQDAKWFSIDEIPNQLGYDHRQIIESALSYLKKAIFDKNILKELFCNEFTLPDIISVYEILLGKEVDRRNLRKKLILKGLIKETGNLDYSKGKRPAKLYKLI